MCGISILQDSPFFWQMMGISRIQDNSNSVRRLRRSKKILYTHAGGRLKCTATEKYVSKTEYFQSYDLIKELSVLNHSRNYLTEYYRYQ
jgi:hypothetical protein